MILQKKHTESKNNFFLKDKNLLPYQNFSLLKENLNYFNIFMMKIISTIDFNLPVGISHRCSYRRNILTLAFLL